MFRHLLKVSTSLLKREFRQRELKILFMATVVSVATVTLISLLGDHLQRILIQSSSQFIAADRQLQSPREIPDEWLTVAESMNIEMAKTLGFASMLFATDQMQLVRVKAVSEGYPLKGHLEVSLEPYSTPHITRDIPELGTIWLNPRLLSLLSVEVGSTVAIGDKEFIVSRLLNREPDVSFGMSALAPRVMINIADLEETGVVQPGSRLNWHYLFSGSDSALTAFEFWLKPNLTSSHRWIGVKEGRPAIANSIDKAETYLLLGGSLAVLLSCVAIAMSARQFSRKQLDAVALLKTLGMNGTHIVSIYTVQIVLLGVVAGLSGTVLGVAGFLLGAKSLASLFPEFSYASPWLNFEPQSLLIGWATGAIVMASFALPPIIKLKKTPPMRVFRRDESVGMHDNKLIWLLGGTGVFALLYLYSGDWKLVVILLAAVMAVSVVLLLISYLLLKSVSIVGTRASSFWRLGLSAIVRRRWQSVFQVQVFSMALMLVAIIYLTRTSLLGDWQTQLPDNAPNHFLINISEEQVTAVNNYFNTESVVTSGLYPMVRGRLTHINGKDVKVAVSKEREVNALNRELNLTWTDQLPTDNVIEQGSWWQVGDEQQPDRVSIESQLAERLGVMVGDRLTFTIGDQRIEADIQSIRSVEWDSMRPNFYMIFPKGVFEQFSATYITSIHLNPQQKSLLNGFSRQFPTVTVLEVDQLIEKIRTIIAQVSNVIELIMYLILTAATLAVAALINVSMGERYKEGALLRTLGARSKVIAGSQFIEFGVIGLLSGTVAVISAEIVVWAIQRKLFETTFTGHPSIWLWLPLISSVLIGGAGYCMVRKVTRLPPVVVLRDD